MPFIDKKVQLPRRGKNGSTKEPVLLREEIPQLLEEFALANSSSNIFVIQGGNRYMSCYLELFLKRQVYSFKLLDVSKVMLNVVLNTLLLPEERSASLTKDCQQSILNEFARLPETSREVIIKNLKAGYDDPADFLRTATIADVVNAIATFRLFSPFSYPADDRKIKQEFLSATQFGLNLADSIQERFILRKLLRETEFLRLAKNDDLPSAFLDDVFYRGRTYFAVLILTSILGVETERWSFHTLCADRVSKNIYAPGITVLKRGVLYPFENSIGTEGGYWEEQENSFVFRDMWQFLEALEQIVQEPDAQLIARWQNRLQDISRALGLKGVRREMVLALVEFYVATTARGMTCDIDSLLDQRARGIANSASFVKVMSLWINQEEPRWKRQQFKNRVRDLLLTLISATSAHALSLLADTRELYQAHAPEIDYFYLRSFYKFGECHE